MRSRAGFSTERSRSQVDTLLPEQNERRSNSISAVRVKREYVSSRS
jgi:hypothetical protein